MYSRRASPVWACVPIDARVNDTLVYTKAMVRAFIKNHATVEGLVRVYPT